MGEILNTMQPDITSTEPCQSDCPTCNQQQADTPIERSGEVQEALTRIEEANRAALRKIAITDRQLFAKPEASLD